LCGDSESRIYPGVSRGGAVAQRGISVTSLRLYAPGTTGSWPQKAQNRASPFVLFCAFWCANPCAILLRGRRIYTQRRMPVSRSAILGRPGRAGMPYLLDSLRQSYDAMYSADTCLRTAMEPFSHELRTEWRRPFYEALSSDGGHFLCFLFPMC